MNIASVVQGVLAAVFAYLAAKGLQVPEHIQALFVPAITAIVAAYGPVLIRWKHAHAREIGAVLGLAVVGLQFAVTLNLEGAAGGFVSAALAFVASVLIPAFGHSDMPAVGLTEHDYGQKVGDVKVLYDRIVPEDEAASSGS